MSNIPDNCFYTDDHEWVRLEGDNEAYIGITDYAQSELGELVYVEVDTVGDSVAAKQIFGTVEAVKTTSDLFMPVGAEVLEFNEALEDSPEIINEDPYGKGWIAKIKLDDPAELEGLLSAAAYAKEIEG